tara:strand:- start:248 stop:433 length:186 start_codon:yes stop_codon:yes gene_type:complete
LKQEKTHNTQSAEAFIKRMAGFRKFATNSISDFPKPILLRGTYDRSIHYIGSTMALKSCHF